MAIGRFPVEAGHILAFARSVGDANAAYRTVLDARSGHPAVAPPTFVRAGMHFDPDAPRPGAAVTGTGRLHAEQHFEYSGVLTAGTVLHTELVPGRGWTKPSRSGDVLDFAETVLDYVDEEGRRRVRSRSISVVRRPADGRVRARTARTTRCRPPCRRR
jgi:hypothetical protein